MTTFAGTKTYLQKRVKKLEEGGLYLFSILMKDSRKTSSTTLSNILINYKHHISQKTPQRTTTFAGDLNNNKIKKTITRTYLNH